MQDVIERPGTMPQSETLEDTASHAALWIVDALAQELIGTRGLDREALLAALSRRGGYQEADSLRSESHEELQAELVARLAGRLARA